VRWPGGLCAGHQPGPPRTVMGCWPASDGALIWDQ
jgi:hypothetical protein